MNTKHPLDDEFDVDEAVFSDDFDDGVEIPESPDERDLDMVINLALQQYKANCDVMHLVEPKNRLKYLELNRDFLNIVKDARVKKDKLAMDRERWLKARPTTAPGAEVQEEEKSSQGEEETVSRDELQRLRRVK